MSTTVLLADDHALLRGGLRSLLDREDGIEVVAEAGDGRAAVQLAQRLSPDVVLMDVTMPGLNGIEATRQILEERAETKVVGLSMHCSKRVVVDMLRAGASGYVVKLSAFDEVARAVRAVTDNHCYLSPCAARLVVEALVDPALASASNETLSPREREVLQLLAEGRNTKEVAAALGIGARTVDSHRARIMNKLGLGSVADLTRYAVKEGLVGLDG